MTAAAMDTAREPRMVAPTTAPSPAAHTAVARKTRARAGQCPAGGAISPLKAAMARVGTMTTSETSTPPRRRPAMSTTGDTGASARCRAVPRSISRAHNRAVPITPTLRMSSTRQGITA